MKPSSYAVVCAVLCGLGDFIVWAGYAASVFISESVLHSVNRRDPDRIGAHDGYYGLAVSNGFYMLSTLFVPVLMNYVRGKWILALSGASFTFYFIAFPFINQYLYFIASIVLGMAFSSYNLGYTGYLTEYSTRQTIEHNQALMWSVSCLDTLGAGIVNFIVTTINLNKNDIDSGYREYSDTEIIYFFAAFTLLGVIATGIFAFLPNREVENSISSSHVCTESLRDQFVSMFSMLFHKRVLILVPFYLHIGIFFSLWTSILPTTLQFTKVSNLFISHAISPVRWTRDLSLLTMRMSSMVNNFSFKPLMIINAIIHASINILLVCVIPQWSTVRPNDEHSLLIQPSVFPVLIIAFLCGLADAANNTTRTVLSSLLVPARRQHTFGASRFYHAFAASIFMFASPFLSIYWVSIILSVFLITGTIGYLYTCDYIQHEEKSLEKAETTCYSNHRKVTDLN